MIKAKLKFMALVLLLAPAISFAQSTKSRIEKALADKEFKLADSLLNKQLTFFFDKGLLDSIPHYIVYAGNATENLSGGEHAVIKVKGLIAKMKAARPGALTISNALRQAAEYFGSQALNDLAYDTNTEAYMLASGVKGIPPETLARINSDLGTFAFRAGNVALAQTHHRKAIKTFLNSSDPNLESLYVAANNMGGIMYMSSKMDSAIYFFDIAIKALQKTERTPLNQYYRPAVIQNSLAGIYSIQGKTTAAIGAMRSCIENVRKYLSVKESIPKKSNAVSFQFEATDNLGGIYKELGDLKQAHDLLYYSYQQKQKMLDADNSGIFKSQILLGQLYYAMKNYPKAIDFLTQGLQNISKADGDYNFWKADAAYTLALIYDVQKQETLAQGYYEKADSLYEVSLQGDYDYIYLEFLKNASLFYAENKMLDKALTHANKSFNYVKKTQGAETLVAFNQLLNLSEVYFLAGDYKRSLQHSEQAIAVTKKVAGMSTNMLDSIKAELNKPKAILMKAKAGYELLEKRDVASLNAILDELNQGLALMEKRKSIIHDPEDVSLLMADHSGLLEFIKKITLELHSLTKNPQYIDKLINLHESGVYSRIRTRLDRSDSIRFSHIPANVQLKEKELKNAITAALQNTESHSRSITEYFKAIENWNNYQQMLKKNYPAYYKMRYESLITSIADIQNKIPENNTLIRYFFINKELYAIVADKKNREFIRLGTAGLEKNITALSNYSSNPAITADALHTLYQQLWAPLASSIKNKKITIIPDGILYTLNFEVLTPKKISSYNQLATHTLLTDHTIAYHYSLFLVGRKNKPAGLTKNFVAFAPGFSDEEKKRYVSSLKDSFHTDKSYVSLLPQPFTTAFSARAKQMLGGQAFLNSQSTAESFKNNAGKHKIIHIGTHAETNNLAPEYSKLIFSKGDPYASNAIFLHEIYNCDLTSELSVLTACESGRPGYEDGEGMISLAHAFNYAGSESILTGLWKIDEKASTMLMEHFYNYLVDGKDKDEALRLAKLDYLKQAEGRMLAPQYWAGLVLMGDTSPIELEKPRTVNWLIIALLALAVPLSFLIYKRTHRGK